MKRSHPITRLIMAAVLLALLVVAWLEFSARGKWNRAFELLEGAQQSDFRDGTAGPDRQDKIRQVLEGEYGAELVEGTAQDFFFFAGVLRTYWVEVGYNALGQSIYVNQHVTTGFARDLPEAPPIP